MSCYVVVTVCSNVNANFVMISVMVHHLACQLVNTWHGVIISLVPRHSGSWVVPPGDETVQ